MNKIKVTFYYADYDILGKIASEPNGEYNMTLAREYLEVAEGYTKADMLAHIKEHGTYSSSVFTPWKCSPDFMGETLEKLYGEGIKEYEPWIDRLADDPEFHYGYKIVSKTGKVKYVSNFEDVSEYFKEKGWREIRKSKVVAGKIEYEIEYEML